MAIRPKAGQFCVRILPALGVLGPLLVAGCASAPPPGDADEEAPPVGVYDPIEPVNRFIFRANEKIDTYVVAPVTEAYVTVTPELGRRSISHFGNNLRLPLNALYQVLQGDFDGLSNDVQSFALNTVFGVGGLLPVAKAEGYESDPEDFGQTLAVWGMPAGPYVVLPLFGPDTLRNAPSRFVQGAANRMQLKAAGVSVIYFPQAILFMLQERAEADPKLQRAKDAAIDPYLFIREALYQRRQFLIRDGEVPEVEEEDLSIDLEGLDLDLPESSEDSP